MAAISVLLSSCCPPAIFGRVGTVVVNAVNGIRLRWARPHVVHKILKRCAPTGTDSNSSPAVVDVAFCGRIEAPFEHAGPYLVLGTVPSPMSSVPHANALGMDLDGGASVNEATTTHPAFYVPQLVAEFAPGVGEHDQTAKLFSGKVLKTWVLRDRIGLNHDTSPTKALKWPESVRAAIPCGLVHYTSFHVSIQKEFGNGRRSAA